MTVTGWGIEERFYEAHAYQEEFWAAGVNACIGFASWMPALDRQTDQTRAIQYLNEIGVTLEKSGTFLAKHFTKEKLTATQFFVQLRPYISNKNQCKTTPKMCWSSTEKDGNIPKPAFTTEATCKAAGFEWCSQGAGTFGRGMNLGTGVRHMRGPTGAQTPTPRYFDHILGVTMKDGPLKIVLDQFHGFIPLAHEKAMEDVRNMRRSAKDYVVDHRNNKELVQAYNKAIAGLAKWRRLHFTAIVEKFAIVPIQQSMKKGGFVGATKEHAWEAMLGTGGSGGKSFLADHIQTTEESALGPCPNGRW